MKIREGFEIRKAGDTSIILRRNESDGPAEGVFVLNETGEFLWNALSQAADEEELYSLLIKEYEVTAGQEEGVRQDIADFLGRLRMIGALAEG